MWLCDRCQEINDDNVSVCPKCGWVNQPNQPPQASPYSANPQKGWVQGAAETISTIAPPGNPPNMWVDMGLAIWKSPVVAVCLIVLLIIDFAPAGWIGPLTLMGSVPSFLLLGSVIVGIWKIIYLGSRGVRTGGTVDDRKDYDYRGGKSYPVSYVTVEYVVGGRAYLTKDKYGGPISAYPDIGDQVMVLYDPKSPLLAFPLLPTHSKWMKLSAGVILGLLLLGLAWTIRYSPGYIWFTFSPPG